MKKLIFIFGLSLALFSCTANERAKNFGGNETIQLKPNEVLINVSWKETNLWMFIEDTSTHTKYYREHSPYGMIEGKINFNPSK